MTTARPVLSAQGAGAGTHDQLAGLGNGAVVIGHSVGGTLLVHTIAQQPPDPPLGGIVLLAAPV
jgi:predicted alpha/beta hydrolase family esterase